MAVADVTGLEVLVVQRILVDVVVAVFVDVFGRDRLSALQEHLADVALAAGLQQRHEAVGFKDVVHGLAVRIVRLLGHLVAVPAEQGSAPRARWRFGCTVARGALCLAILLLSGS